MHNFTCQGKQYGDRYAAGDTIDVWLDLQKLELSFGRNGEDYGKAWDVQETDYHLAISINSGNIELISFVYFASFPEKDGEGDKSKEIEEKLHADFWVQTGSKWSTGADKSNGIFPDVPKDYICKGCNESGDHWIMNCYEFKLLKIRRQS